MTHTGYKSIDAQIFEKVKKEEIKIYTEQKLRKKRENVDKNIFK